MPASCPLAFARRTREVDWIMHMRWMPGWWVDVRTAPCRPYARIGSFAVFRQRGPGGLLLAGLLATAPPCAHAAVPAAEQQTVPPAQPQTARPCASVAETGRPRITVAVSGVRSVAGNITFTLYGDQPARFLAHKGSIAVERVMLTERSAQGCFVVSRPGTYAVAVYHDENNNHHFDRSLIGLPVEGYGFSRNAPIFMAPPSFGAVRFEAGAGETSLSIALRY